MLATSSVFIAKISARHVLFFDEIFERMMRLGPRCPCGACVTFVFFLPLSCFFTIFVEFFCTFFLLVAFVGCPCFFYLFDSSDTRNTNGVKYTVGTNTPYMRNWFSLISFMAFFIVIFLHIYGPPCSSDQISWEKIIR